MINDEIVNDRNIDLIEQRLHVHAPFSLESLPFQTCQQSAFVDAERHRRVDRGHGCSQVLERTFRHSRIGQSQPRALRITRSRISAAEISLASKRASCSRQYADGCPPSIRVMARAFLMLSALDMRSRSGA